MPSNPSDGAPMSSRQDVSVRAWIKPLKNGTWQYYAKVNGEQRAMGAAHSAICDYVYKGLRRVLSTEADHA